MRDAESADHLSDPPGCGIARWAPGLRALSAHATQTVQVREALQHHVRIDAEVDQARHFVRSRLGKPIDHRERSLGGTEQAGGVEVAVNGMIEEGSHVLVSVLQPFVILMPRAVAGWLPERREHGRRDLHEIE